MMLKLENVSKSLGGRLIVGPISLDLPVGATTVLLGPHDSGKSTVLRLFIGLVKADTGDVLVDNISLNDDTIHGILRRIGYIPSDGGLFPHMSVLDNVTLQLKRAKVQPDLIQGRLNDLMALFRVSQDGLRRFPHQLTPWQRLRVALFRALMLDPPILIFDDPLSDVDYPFQHAIRKQLDDMLQRLRKTVLMASADKEDAAYFADQVVLMDQGIIVQQGHMMDLLNNPADDFVRNFLQPEYA